MAFLREEAENRGCSLYEALQFTIDNEIFKGTKAKELFNAC